MKLEGVPRISLKSGFLKADILTAFKKPEATKCIDHNTVSLTKHTAKIVVRLLRRIERKFEDVLRRSVWI